MKNPILTFTEMPDVADGVLYEIRKAISDQVLSWPRSDEHDLAKAIAAHLFEVYGKD